MKATAREPLEFSRKTARKHAPKPAPGAAADGASPAPAPAPARTGSSLLEARQRRFLALIAAGYAVSDACMLAGTSCAAYEKWRTRYPGFPERVEAAREAHRREAASGLHRADAYARMLLDAIQRDEALPAALRYRAAKSILTRRGKQDWLPEPLPASTKPLAAFDETLPASDVALAVSDEPLPACDEARASHDNETPAPDPEPFPASIRKPPASESSHPNHASNPDIPDIPDIADPLPSPVNPLTNQSDSRTQAAAEAPILFSTHPDTDSFHESATLPNPAARSNPAPRSNPAQPCNPAPSCHTAPPCHTASSFEAARLLETWLSPAFLYRHESRESFEQLLENHLKTYQPASPIEERLAFRLTQQAWRIQRLDTLERVLADSAVTQLREQYPGIAAPAALALSRYEAPDARFHEHIARQRRQHEAAQTRLEATLFTIQQRRRTAIPRTLFCHSHPSTQQPLRPPVYAASMKWIPA